MRWREQYDRTKRWYDRFATIAEGRVHDMPSDNYVDEIYAFFLNCYHIKDWLKADSSVPGPVQDMVEAHVNGERSLLLCADICNALKHLSLSAPRSGENPTFGRKDFALQLGPGTESRIRFNYEVTTSSGSEDAFELAGESIAAWDRFLDTHGLM